jgi:hypothetical protein
MAFWSQGKREEPVPQEPLRVEVIVKRPAEKLLVHEARLQEFTVETKLLVTHALNPLKAFMDKHAFFRDLPKDHHRYEDAMFARSAVFYPDGAGELSKEHYKELAKRGAAAKQPKPDEHCKKALVLLVRAYDHAVSIEKLAKQEQDLVEAANIAADIIEKTTIWYKHVLEPRRDMTKLKEFEVAAEKAAQADMDAAKRVNDLLIVLVRDMLALIKDAKKEIDNAELDVFLDEYKEVRARVMPRLKQLSDNLMNWINSEEMLANKLFYLEDKDVEEFENLFNVRLRNEHHIVSNVFEQHMSNRRPGF